MIIFLFICLFCFNGCTRGDNTIHGKEYTSYGLLNMDEKDPKVKYEPMWMNMFVGVIFSELIIPPIYVFGFHCMEPVAMK